VVAAEQLVNSPDTYTVAMDVLQVFSVVVAFLAFFGALRFSAKWPEKAVRLFKVLVGITSAGALSLGAASLWLFLVHGALGAAACPAISVVVEFSILCMMAATLGVAYLTIAQG